MSRLLIVFLAILIFAGCVSPEPDATPIATDVPSCGDWQVSGESFHCIIMDDGLLIQSGIEQITLSAYDASIVVYGTIFMLGDDERYIMVLEGDAVISSRGQNRVTSTGRRVTLPIVDNLAEAPSDITRMEIIPDNLPLADLPRSIDTSTILIEPTPEPATIPIIPDNSCQHPENWITQYTIASGDTLAGIANRYDLTVNELAEGNCLIDVSRIIVGQVLFVPLDESDAETNTMTVSIGFRADTYNLAPGNCTILRWDAFSAMTIFLDDETVHASSSQEVCPDETTSYTLRVILGNEQEAVRELTVSVQE